MAIFQARDGTLGHFFASLFQGRYSSFFFSFGLEGHFFVSPDLKKVFFIFFSVCLHK